MKKTLKNIVLVAVLFAATAVAYAQKNTPIRDYTSWPIDTTGQVQKYCASEELLVSIGAQAKVVGVQSDMRRSVEVDTSGIYTVSWDARTIHGWTLGAGVGFEADIKAKDREVFCFGPLFRLYGSYYGPWYEFSVNLDYTRQANPLQAGETYWAWGFNFNPKFFLARGPKGIDLNIFYVDLILGVQQAKTASHLFFEDETVTVNFTENSTDFTYAMGAGLGFQHRFFSQGWKVGVQADFITYAGSNVNKITHNGVVLVDNKEQIRMLQPRLTVYVGYTIGRRAAEVAKYNRQQFQLLRRAAMRVKDGEWPPKVEDASALPK